MPIHHRQVAGSGDGTRGRDNNDTAVLKFAVIGTEDPLEAEDYVIDEGLFPIVYDTKKLEGYRWDEVEPGYYLFTGSYSFKRLEVDEWTLAIDTSGGSIRMTTSLATTRYAPAGKTAPDFAGAIEIDDGKPKGIDRVIPAVKLNVTYRMTRPANVLAFTAIASGLTGTVNNAPILGHQAGELLFLGASGDFGNNVDPTFQFSWAASKNASLSIGSIASINKAGHEYLWILYEEEKAGAGADAYMVTKPRAVYVERIYELADHSLLGLLL